MFYGILFRSYHSECLQQKTKKRKSSAVPPEQNAMAAFEDNAPTYHLELRDRPTLVWDFHSLLLNVKLLIFLSLTDENNPLKVCRKCGKPFIASKPADKYCSEDCRGKRKKAP